MLVLTRKRGESLIADTPIGPVKVHVLDARPGRVRLGIEAPPQINVLRQELAEPPLRRILDGLRPSELTAGRRG